MSGIFISYRRDDTRGSAGRLYGDLTSRFGSKAVSRDLDAIRPGADYLEAIDSLVEACDAMVVVIGDRWLDAGEDAGRRRLEDPDDFVRREVGAALKATKLVIPVLVDGAVMPGPSDLPPDLASLGRRNALPLTDLRWNYDVGVLAERLEEVVETRPTSVARPRPVRDSGGLKRRLMRVGRRPWVPIAAVVVLVGLAVALVWPDSEPGEDARRGPANLVEPAGVAMDASGSLFIADGGSYRVRKLGPDGTITTVAGTGEPGSEGDGGPAGAATVEPGPLAVDVAGNLYIAQGDPGGIRKVAANGIISGVPARAPGTDHLEVTAMVVGHDGALVIATNREVLRVRADGALEAVAGSVLAGFAGDGGPATSAKLDSPSGLAIANDGTIYIADTGNNRIRKVSQGIITTVAGTGKPEASGDMGPAIEAGVPAPSAVAVGDDGSLYIGTDNQVRRVVDDIIALVAGNPDDESGFSGDSGPAPSAHLDGVNGLVLSREGILYVSDSGNGRVRAVSRDGIITTVA
ncbi:MAG: TIR domain-containing protein [Acidimicrobiales bacterium]